MAAKKRRVLVPRLNDRFEEPVIDVAILERVSEARVWLPYSRTSTSSQKFRVRKQCFCDATNWEWQVTLLCFPSVHWQIAGARANGSIVVVVSQHSLLPVEIWKSISDDPRYSISQRSTSSDLLWVLCAFYNSQKKCLHDSVIAPKNNW